MTMLEALKRGVENHQFIKYNKQKLDVFSASAILAVYDKLNEANQEKYKAIIEKDVYKAATIAFKLVK